MRGKRRRSIRTLHHEGITPADAGKTHSNGTHGTFSRDHPRGCGENSCNSSIITGKLGSPPRMRGKPVQSECPPSELRITPADAGKTRIHITITISSRDHPRGCGENSLSSSSCRSRSGSPPRMRGKRRLVRGRRISFRITPADAGKTDRMRTRSARWQDHPRGCGENQCSNRDRCLQSGSPPRMRGKPLCGFRVQAAARITPADAGKTL